MINNIINSIKVGDKVNINSWDSPMNVCGVSDHYIIMVDNLAEEYSIISKWMEDGGILLWAR